MLQLVSLLFLAYSFFVTRTIIPTLPLRIPTHFNAAGEANGWGSPDILWFLLGAQLLTTAIFLAVPYLGQLIPGAMHFGNRRLSDFPPARRPQMLSIMSDMAADLSIVMNVFFVMMMHEIIRTATEPVPRLHPRLPMAFLIGGMSVITAYHLWKFSVAAKDAVNEDSHSSLGRR